MRGLFKAFLALNCIVVPTAMAKNDKPILPAYVLQAHTVAVVIDPDAGFSVDDPRGNEVAQKDVETALLNWGRFLPVLSVAQADLVIVVRKGNRKLVNETISDPRQNNRPGSITPIQDGVAVGGQHGSGGAANPDGTSRPQLEVGAVDDSFLVYEGNTEQPLENQPAWRWTRKDALHPHDVPAVDEFRKVLVEAEKQAAKQAAKHP